MILLLFLINPFCTSVLAQTKLWEKSFAGNKDDLLRKMVPVPSGGYLIGGTSNSGKGNDKSQASKGKADFWIVKLNSNSEKVWDKTIGSNGNDNLSTMLATPDGGYLLGGTSSSNINGDKTEASRGYSDYWVVKVDANGNKLWDKTFGGTSRDSLSAIIPTPDGNYLLAGTSNSNKANEKSEAAKGSIDYWIIKISDSGTKIWDKTFGGTDTDELSDIIITADNGFLLGGSSLSGIGGDKSEPKKGICFNICTTDYWILKVSESGEKIWDKTIGGNFDDNLDKVVTTADGGYILGGSSNSGKLGDKSEFNNGESQDFWIVKVDGSGEKVWDKTYDTYDEDYLREIYATADDGFLLAGFTGIHGSNDYADGDLPNANYWVIKIDKNGNQDWAKEFTEEYDEGQQARVYNYLFDITPTADGNYLLSGYSRQVTFNEDEYRYTAGFADYFLIKIQVPAKQNQTITFEPVLNKTLADAPFAITATSTSALPITFSIIFGPATAKDSIITLTGTGAVTIKASQAGNEAFFAAPEVIQTFLVEENLPVTKQWDRTYGGTFTPSNSQVEGDYGTSELVNVVVTPDGGFLFGGSSDSYPGGDKSKKILGGGDGYDFWLVRTDNNGKKIWDNTYGTYMHERLSDVIATPDEGLLIGGESDSGYLLIKLDGSGAIIWQKTYPDIDYVNVKLATTPDGGYLLASSAAQDYWVLKINAAGEKVWEKTYGGTGTDMLTTVTATLDGGFLLGGYSSSDINGDKSQATQGNYDFWVVKIDSSGTKIWDKTFGGNESDALQAIIATPDGGFLLGGSSGSGISGDKTEAGRDTSAVSYLRSDYWIVKIDAKGDKKWDKTFGGSNADGLRAISNSAEGGFWLGGNSRSSISGDKTQTIRGGTDYWVIKIDANGNKVLDKVYGGNGYEELITIKRTLDGGTLLAGNADVGKGGDKSSGRKGIQDFWAVKIDGQPVNPAKQEQTITFNAIPRKPYSTEPFLLAATSTSGLVVTYKVVMGPATLSGNKLNTVGMGLVTVKASQAGNSAFLPASDVYRTFMVEQVSPISVLWDKTIGAPSRDNFSTFVTTPDGGYLLGGTSYSSMGGDKTQASKGGDDYWIVKTDANGNKLWDKTFGGSKDEALKVIVATPDGGFLLGGDSYSGVSGDKSEANRSKDEYRGTGDYWIIKIDANGNKLWDKTIGGNGRDVLSAIAPASDGGYLLGGTSQSGVSGDKTRANRGECYSDDICAPDYWIVKIDANGNKLWDKIYGGLEGESLSNLILTPDGGFLLAGISDSDAGGDKTDNSKGSYDYWIVKIDVNGKKLWDKTIGSISADHLQALVAAADGGYLLGGVSDSGISADKSEISRGSGDYWIVKVDALGKKTWDKTFGGNNYDLLTALVANPDGSFLLGGNSSSVGGDKSEISRDIINDDENDEGGGDYWIIKVDSKGAKIWDKTLGGNAGEYLSDLLITPDGSYVAGGSSASNKEEEKSQDSKGYIDYWIIKFTDNILPPVTSSFNLRYGGSGTDRFTTVIKTSDGGYISGGYSNSGVSGDKSQGSKGGYDYWIVKTDVNGAKQWDITYGGSADDYLARIIQTKDGGYILAGSSKSSISGDKTAASRGDQDYWIIKISSSGQKLWDKTYGGTGFDDLRKVNQLSDGGYIIAGQSTSPLSGDKSQESRGNTDYWIIRIDQSGTKLWDKGYGGTHHDFLETFTKTSDGGFLLAGSSASGFGGDKTQASNGSRDYWIVKVDSKGMKEWDKGYGGSGSDQLYSIGVSSKGNYFVAGSSASGRSGDKTQESKGKSDYWMLLLNIKGEKLWDKSFGGGGTEELRSIIQSKQGGYILAGSSDSNISGDKTQTSQGGADYWIVKTDAQGNQDYDQRYGGSGKEEFRYIQQEEDGRLVLGGRSDSDVSGDRTQPSQGSTDYWLVKVAPVETSSDVVQAAKVNIPHEQVSEEFSNYQLSAFPNPFTEKLTISFTLKQTQLASLKLYDIRGREIAILYQGKVGVNENKLVEWQVNTPLSNGLYILRLQTPTQVSTRKLLFIR